MLIDELKKRSENRCELTGRTENLTVYSLSPNSNENTDNSILVCEECLKQIKKNEQMDSQLWKPLTEYMWSEHTPVQVVAWRMLNRLKHESWAAEALDILYLDEETIKWAKLSGDHQEDSTVQFHQDANGTRLYNGDAVVLTKTLDVKGSSISAKLGTVVKNIRLVSENHEQIEGKIGGQTIVILTKYLRKNK